MPPVYVSVSSDALQVNNNSNTIQAHIQTNNSLEAIVHIKNTTQLSYRIFTTDRTTATTPKRLKPVEIVFIVLGVIAVFILLCAGVIYVYRRWKHKKSSRKTTAPKPPIKSTTPAVDFKKHPDKTVIRPPVNPPHIRRQPPSSGKTPSKPSIVLPLLQCRKPLCIDYFKKLNIPKAYFANQYDKCYCKKCHDPSNIHIKCGNWCTEFHRWIRLGLRPNEAHSKQWNIFRTWKTSYYGTSPDLLLSILSNRFIPLDGDELTDGTTFTSGHPDRQHCTTCPSLACASQSKFCVQSNFKAIDGNNYYVQVVLQCKQQPDTIIVKEDMKASKRFEWSTKARSSVVPFGLLIRLQKI